MGTESTNSMNMRESLQSIINDFKALQNLGLKEATGGTTKYEQRGNPGRRGAKTLYDRQGFGKPKDFGSDIAELEKTIETIANLVKRRRQQMEHRSWLIEAFGDNHPDATEKLRTKEALKMVGCSPVEAAYILGYRDSKTVVELRKRHGLDYWGEKTERPKTYPYNDV